MNSLGIDKDPKDTRVVVAMSGGVDSSVTAAMLHEEGYDVVGVTLQLYDHGAAIEKKGACCAGQDIYDAKRVAEECGFPHYVLDYEDRFRQSVMDDFADSYLKGETPIPCVRCNQTVKFRDLFQTAKDLGADCMATGHYIHRKINPETGRAELYRANDSLKDQSYFLFATTQEQLDFLRFPLGAWTKDKVRERAIAYGLINAQKSDSQDICFVPNGDYAGIVKKMRPESQKSGPIRTLDGRDIGRHNGIIHYTIGQRKGLGIGGGVSENNAPFYVVSIDPANDAVIVGPKEALARDTVYIEDCNWLFDPEERAQISRLTSPSLPASDTERSASPNIILHNVKTENVAKVSLSSQGKDVECDVIPSAAKDPQHLEAGGPLTTSASKASYPPEAGGPSTTNASKASYPPEAGGPSTTNASKASYPPEAGGPSTTSLTGTHLSRLPDLYYVKLRSMMAPIPARIELGENGTATIHLLEPHYGIAAGQAAVVYRDNRLLGGGWITGTENTAFEGKLAA